MTNIINKKEGNVDQILIERAQQGDSRAFDMLVIKYQRRLSGAMTRFLKDDYEIQDIVQEAFIKAYRALPNFRGESAFFTWLYRIAANTAKNYLSSGSKKYLVLDNDFKDDDATWGVEQTPDYNTPENAFLNQEILHTVGEAVENLPEDLKAVINLREIEGLSYEAIAERMNCPVGTVRSRLFRARELIAKDLRPVLDTSKNQRW
ncbi:MAG: RNA polymerase sigma factor RpoE [Neisseriaceae bacterium]|nr:MAG: RNA polymerase sigma factor RpoE [Neisseriaceae bacterium]